MHGPVLVFPIWLGGGRGAGLQDADAGFPRWLTCLNPDVINKVIDGALT